jgi:hypothetical protein
MTATLAWIRINQRLPAGQPVQIKPKENILPLIKVIDYFAVAVAYGVSHYAANRKVASSVPDEMIFKFN